MEMHAPEPPQAANELKPLKPAPVVAAPVAIPTSMPATATPAAVAATPAKKPPVVPIAIAAILVIAIGIAYFAMRKPKTVTPVVAKPPVVQTQTTATSIAATSTAPVLGTTATTSTAPSIDPSKVNEEVAKRMAAEKARLDQLARAQNQQTTSSRPVAAPPPQQVATQTVAPPPVVESRPAPVPQPTAPAPQPVVENRPAPQPEAPRTQVGDLIPAGTPGLTPAHITHQAAATYPPIARIQHVQGSVVVAVLVSESGQVLDTRVVSGPQAVLNEAAQQSIRRSTFSAGEKDGVRVKSWTNVRVDFKL
jgi:protein TonB